MTEAGRQLYDRAAQILAEGEAAENEVLAHSAVPRAHGVPDHRKRPLASAKGRVRHSLQAVQLWEVGDGLRLHTASVQQSGQPSQHTPQVPGASSRAQ